MKTYPSNQDRTLEYLTKFNREKILKSLLNMHSPIIFDIGANDGSSLLEFKDWWPNSTIHCFEPQEECWAALDHKASSYADNTVIINKVAVGNEHNKKIPFYSHEINSGVSGCNKININSIDSINIHTFSKNNLNEYKGGLNHERFVSTIRLEEYIKLKKIDNINLLKIDTQGFEPEVLMGLGQNLSNVDIVISELMFYDFYERSLSFTDIEKFLIPSGFQMYDISHISKNPMNGRTDWVDVIYVNKRLRNGR